jgi:ribose 5-phosphate isomerase B
MRIAFAADEATELSGAVLSYLKTVADVHVIPPSECWPAYARAVGEAVAGGDCDLGVVICWTGTGTCIAANKVPGVRAALAFDRWIAEGARRWNDANVLALSSKRTAPDVAVEAAKAFVETSETDPDERANIAMLRDGRK